VFSSKVGKIEAYMSIDTGDYPPVKKRPYHLRKFRELQIEEHISHMLDAGVIEIATDNEWSSPCFCVP
jgi:hypothetical protein